jgi:RHS repeat-associated protein
MTWDALGRLVGVTRRNSANSGFNWSAVYDGLNRRLQTTQQAVTGGALTGTSFTLKSSYDPEVEFLELAVTSPTARYWKVHGPDLNGKYGGLQGTGGLEAVYNGTTGVTTSIMNDTYGSAEVTLTASGSSISYVYNPVAGSGYGSAPGGLAAVPMDATHDLGNVIAWRGHYVDGTGYYYMGMRYYAQDTGSFLSPDPLGHAACADLYSYCNGDPVNFLDPDGRDATMGDLIRNGTLPKYGANVVGSPTYNAGTAHANEVGPVYAKWGVIAGSGLAIGTGSGIVIAGGVELALAAGVSKSVVSGALILTGGFGVVSTYKDLKADHSLENIVYTASAFGGAAFVGGSTARTISELTSRPGDGPPAQGWPALFGLEKAWKNKAGEGRIAPEQFLWDWLSPTSTARPMATGPDMWGAAATVAGGGVGGASLLNAGTDRSLFNVGNGASLLSTGQGNWQSDDSRSGGYIQQDAVGKFYKH